MCDSEAIEESKEFFVELKCSSCGYIAFHKSVVGLASIPRICVNCNGDISIIEQPQKKCPECEYDLSRIAIPPTKYCPNCGHKLLK